MRAGINPCSNKYGSKRHSWSEDHRPKRSFLLRSIGKTVRAPSLFPAIFQAASSDWRSTLMAGSALE